MSWTRSVLSSNVEEIYYDSDTQEMAVTWHSGKVSVYSGVPEDVALDVSNAPSVGQAMNEKVKGQYDHRYV